MSTVTTAIMLDYLDEQIISAEERGAQQTLDTLNGIRCAVWRDAERRGAEVEELARMIRARNPRELARALASGGNH